VTCRLRVGELVLGERERDLAATRRAQDRLDDEIAAAEARFAQLGGRLSARMGVLGERDRELAESSQALAALQQRADAEEARHAAAVALGRIADPASLVPLERLAADYTEVSTRRALLRACQECQAAHVQLGRN